MFYLIMLTSTDKSLTNVGIPFPQLLSHLVKLYLSFLAIRNIPILEAMYRYSVCHLMSIHGTAVVIT